MVLDLGASSGGPPSPADAADPQTTAGGDRAARRIRSRAPRLPGTALLYERVVALVERLIAEQDLRPGDMLPSYTELADQAGVSLITVRRALDELQRAGRVRRHQGLGTFVAKPRIVSEPGRTGSLLGTLAERGELSADLVTRVLSVQQGKPSPDLARALHIETGSPVWRLRRLRLLGGQPAVLETTVIPADLAPGLDTLVGRLTGSLYDLLASDFGLVDAYEEQYLEVIMPTQEESRLLDLSARTQVVRIRGLSMDNHWLPFDCFEQLYPANQFAFAISGSATRQLLPSPGHRDWGVRDLR